MRHLERYYRILEIEPGASADEINQAYKDLAFIWHPDRIPLENERLREKAQRKLQELNEAREKLRSHKNQTQGKFYQAASRGSTTSSYTRTTPKPPTATKTYSYQKSYQSAYQQPKAEPKAESKASQAQAKSEPKSEVNRHQEPANTPTEKTSEVPKSSYTKSDSVKSDYPKSDYPKSDSQQRSYRPPYDTSDRFKPPAPHPDLSGKDFSNANLSNKDLSGRNLSHANLSGANLSDTFMHKVILRGANLSEANLFRANLLLADLREANLRNANLIGADLSGADLRGADLTGARVMSGDRVMVKLIGANLSGMIMPDGSIHK